MDRLRRQYLDWVLCPAKPHPFMPTFIGRSTECEGGYARIEPFALCVLRPKAAITIVKGQMQVGGPHDPDIESTV